MDELNYSDTKQHQLRSVDPVLVVVPPIADLRDGWGHLEGGGQVSRGQFLISRLSGRIAISRSDLRGLLPSTLIFF